MCKLVIATRVFAHRQTSASTKGTTMNLRLGQPHSSFTRQPYSSFARQPYSFVTRLLLLAAAFVAVSVMAGPSRCDARAPRPPTPTPTTPPPAPPPRTRCTAAAPPPPTHTPAHS